MKLQLLLAEGGAAAAANLVGAVEAQLIGGHPVMGLTPVLHVTGEALLSAPAEGPGTYTLWCAPSGQRKPSNLSHHSLAHIFGTARFACLQHRCVV